MVPLERIGEAVDFFPWGLLVDQQQGHDPQADNYKAIVTHRATALCMKEDGEVAPAMIPPGIACSGEVTDS